MKNVGSVGKSSAAVPTFIAKAAKGKNSNRRQRRRGVAPPVNFSGEYPLPTIYFFSTFTCSSKGYKRRQGRRRFSTILTIFGAAP